MIPTARAAWPLAVVLAISVFATAAGAQEMAVATTEQDFFAELPIVLTVSRLPQRVEDAPGAVTVIDAEMIRASGVREVADLFRLIPGFQVTYANGANPVVSYHGLNGADQFSQRMQVLVDGRTIYSPFQLGGVNWNLLPISLADIERIEVLRGSNSAAYGSNAFLGVANIVTKHPTGQRSWAVSFTHGTNGIDERRVQAGGALDDVSLRFTAEERKDDGFERVFLDPRDRLKRANLFDSKRIRLANTHLDYRFDTHNDIEVQAGAVEYRNGEGFIDGRGVQDFTNPERFTTGGAEFIQARWRRVASAEDEFSLRFYHLRERGTNQFDITELGSKVAGAVTQELLGALVLGRAPALLPIACARLGIAPCTPTPATAAAIAASPLIPPSVRVDFNYRATRTELEVQQTSALGAGLRLVAGASVREDRVTSTSLLGTNGEQEVNLLRAFANIEWRLRPNFVVNGGGLWERDSVSGRTLSPRVMANWHMADDHVLRFGVTQAYRTPALFEEKSNSTLVAGPFLADQIFLSSGGLEPERVVAKEVGYLGNLRAFDLRADVRVFRERVRNHIVEVQVCTPPGTELVTVAVADDPLQRDPCAGTGRFTDFRNGAPVEIRGAEFRLEWRPTRATRLTASHAEVRIAADDSQIVNSAPRHSSSLMLIQRLPGDLQFSATHQAVGAVEYSDAIPRFRRTDLRLAWPFRAGGARGELAVTVQNLHDPYQEYRNDFLFKRRTYATLEIGL